MREKIIKYLQGIQCEWFPVEWDSYFVEWLATEIECYDISGIKMRYFFEGKDCNIQYVQNVDGKNVTFTHFSHYGTLDRCKTLLRNAVRSVDELKRKAADEKNNGYEIEIDGGDVRIYALFDKVPRCRIIWKNGEFK